MDMLMDYLLQCKDQQRTINTDMFGLMQSDMMTLVALEVEIVLVPHFLVQIQTPS